MIRFGLIGTNFISEWFTAACGATDGRASAAAVYSRELTRGRAFADAHGITDAFDDPAAMIGAVDAVYVASPNKLHAHQALQAIAAGRHVLVEKTIGTTTAEVERIFEAAEARGVIAMEAMRNVHTPAHRLLRETLPRLGTLRYARIEKLQYSSRYDKVRAGEYANAFDPALGNSSLADIGVYCLQPALDLFGVPATTSGAGVRLDNGFEGAGTLQLHYGSLVVDVVYGKVVAGLGPSVIHGEDAALEFNDPGELSKIVLHERGGAPSVLLADPPVQPVDTMHHELNDFVDQVDAGTLDPRWRDLSLATRRIMDEQLARPGD